jgi:Rod binding domain-containing protein
MAPSPVSAPVLASPDAPKPKNAEEAAKEFESLLISQMLRSVREQDEGDSESSTMLDVADQQFAKLLADHGGFGLARLIVGQAFSPAD